MDTSYYFYIGYALFWVIPLGYLFFLGRKVGKIEKQLSEKPDRA